MRKAIEAYEPIDDDDVEYGDMSEADKAAIFGAAMHRFSEEVGEDGIGDDV